MPETEDLQETYPGAGTFKFGDSKDLCQDLIQLVRNGKKTATCGAASDFADEPEAMPVVGRCDIAANWDGTPLSRKPTGNMAFSGPDCAGIWPCLVWCLTVLSNS